MVLPPTSGWRIGEVDGMGAKSALKGGIEGLTVDAFLIGAQQVKVVGK